eukprot:COSAG02_NODE_1635_length_11556_cov_149.231300_5_plen_95_part_00
MFGLLEGYANAIVLNTIERNNIMCTPPLARIHNHGGSRVFAAIVVCSAARAGIPYVPIVKVLILTWPMKPLRSRVRMHVAAQACIGILYLVTLG